jgi:hypothetical protein
MYKVSGFFEALENLLQVVVQALNLVRREAEMLALLLGNPLLVWQAKAVRYVLVQNAEELAYRSASVAVDECHSDSRALRTFRVFPELDHLNGFNLQRTYVGSIHSDASAVIKVTLKKKGDAARAFINNSSPCAHTSKNSDDAQTCLNTSS